nr:hypothetical protein [Candidatus Dependentiae bacterium]
MVEEKLKVRNNFLIESSNNQISNQKKITIEIYPFREKVRKSDRIKVIFKIKKATYTKIFTVSFQEKNENNDMDLMEI